MKKGIFSIFRSVTSNKEETLSEAVKFLDWGSNREIKEKGFRVSESFEEFLPVIGGVADLCKFASEAFSSRRKEIALVKEPGKLLNHGNLVFTPSGDSAFIFLVINDRPPKTI